MLKHGIWVLAFAVLFVLQAGAQPRTVGAWEFNGGFTARVGQDAVPFGSGVFETLMINNQPAQVWHFSNGTYIGLYNDAGANGGGQKTNQYTLLMDVLYPSTPGYVSLYQTDIDNVTDGDWFIHNVINGLGISGDYSDPALTFRDGVWQRVVLVIDTTTPPGSNETKYRCYINGQLQNIVQNPSGWGVDGRFALDPTALLFADEDGEQAEGFINNLQLRNYAMADAEIVALGLPGGGSIPTGSGVVGAWGFNGDFSAQIGREITPVGAGTFETTTINNQAAQVYHFQQGSYLSVPNDAGANGGGAKTNQYTIIMDVMFPSTPGYVSFLQTNPANSDDGDWFLNPGNGLGISGDYSEPGGLVFQDGVWQRLALVIDTTTPTGDNCKYRCYINGRLQNVVQFPSGWGVDQRFSLCTPGTCTVNGFYVFADEDGETAEGYINSLQLRNYAMSDLEIAALGGPSAAGIHLTVPGDVDVDNCVNDKDLSRMLHDFGTGASPGDQDNDGDVDNDDIALALRNFALGAACSP